MLKYLFKNKEKENELIEKIEELEYAYQHVVKKYNGIVEFINSRGGESFLFSDQEKKLDDNQLKKILMLCHPDKHDGSKLSNEVTRLLISMREE